MERIRNIYCWDCLRDWNEARGMGIIHTAKMHQRGEDIFGWEQLANMAHEDCFPQSFLCFRKNNANYLVLTKEQEKIFDFINDKIMLQEREEEGAFFSDFPAEYKDRVLSARVDSIWIQLEEAESYIQ